MHVLHGLRNLRIFELVHLKVDISLSIDIFFYVCKAKIYTVSRSSSQRLRRQKVHYVCFHYFTKARIVFIVSAHK